MRNYVILKYSNQNLTTKKAGISILCVNDKNNPQYWYFEEDIDKAIKDDKCLVYNSEDFARNVIRHRKAKNCSPYEI